MGVDRTIIQGRGFDIPMDDLDYLEEKFKLLGYLADDDDFVPDEAGYWLEVNYPGLQYATVGNEWNGENMSFLVLAKSTYESRNLEDMEGGLFSKIPMDQPTWEEYKTLREVYCKMNPDGPVPFHEYDRRLIGLRIW